ncbi:HesB/YadR/YfhF family protein [Alicyclobacillus tolerans]|uniref:Uncharacterized protein YneR n=1 Tax=Alicyclobacillus tolerans TaxID=90970 RepID=A0A1M6Y058_9BACL|nr:hypothetical protein [Alicyclobacillus montanus]SHL11475.1 Uncharacterized protein YneR [Alicyclobacillus montanus]
MRLIIPIETVQWFETNYWLTSGDFIRFYVRYGGDDGIYPGFSLAATLEMPKGSLAVQAHISSYTFYMLETDSWYLGNRDLKITIIEDSITYTLL